MKTKTAVFYPATGTAMPFVFAGKKPTLTELQSAVGGYVEALYIASDCVALVNEDGLRLGLVTNVDASKLCGRPIIGDVLVLSRSLMS